MKKYLYLLVLVIPVMIFAAQLSPGQKALNHENKVADPTKITILQNDSGGKFLLLSNGERWEIYDKDTDYSGGWINGNLTFKKQDTEYRRSGKKYYRYKIYNDATNDFVWGRLVDTQSR